MLLVGGDHRQYSKLAQATTGQAVIVGHWECDGVCNPPKNDPEVILCYIKHCRKRQTEQARVLATKLKVPIRNSFSMIELIEWVQPHLPLPALIKPNAKELKRAVWERWNRNAPNLSVESERIQGCLQAEYGWTTTTSNIQRIIRANRNGWQHGRYPENVQEAKRTTNADILPEAPPKPEPEAPRAPTAKELQEKIGLTISAIRASLDHFERLVKQMPSEEDSEFWEGEAERYKQERDNLKTKLALVHEALGMEEDSK